MLRRFLASVRREKWAILEQLVALFEQKVSEILLVGYEIGFIDT